MIKKIITFTACMLFAGPAAADQIKPLTDAVPAEVFRYGSTVISYCAGQLPDETQINKTFLMSRRDERAFEKAFASKQPFSTVVNSGVRSVRQFLLALRKKESMAVLFKCSWEFERSFVVQVTFDASENDDESSKPFTDVRIYGTSEDVPKPVLEFVKTSILQRGWFRLNKYKTVVAILVPVLFLAARLVPQALTHWGYISPKILDPDFPRPVTEVEWLEWKKGDTSCSICLEDDQGGLMAHLCPQPLHKFHQECWDGAMNRKRECPLCRVEIPLIRKEPCKTCNEVCPFMNGTSFAMARSLVFAGSWKAVYGPWLIGGGAAMLLADRLDARTD